MPQRAKLLIVLAANAAIAALVLRNVQSHAPVQRGTPSQFWMVTCGIDIDGKTKQFDGFGGGAYPPQDEWAIYYIQRLHEQLLFRVPLEELVPQLPELTGNLKPKVNDDDTSPFHEHLLANWMQKSSDDDEVRRLITVIREARLVALGAQDKADGEQHDRRAWSIWDDNGFLERWQRAQRYWLTVLFEVVWLSLVLWFAAWPWIRNRGRLAWTMHLGLTLPLLFVPLFLGYNRLAFSSSFPGGGIYYPYVVIQFYRLPTIRADQWLLEHAPPIFEPLTQESGPWAAISEFGRVGPIAISMLGVAISVAIYSCAAIGKRLNDFGFYAAIWKRLSHFSLKGLMIAVAVISVLLALSAFVLPKLILN
jgi:hypothetical protein